MADESKRVHCYYNIYNIGCKWRYKQMRYYECSLKMNSSKKREQLDRRCKIAAQKNDLSNNFNVNNNNISQTSNEEQLCCDWINCDKIFKSWFQLQRHRCSHNKHSVKPYDCDWKGCRNKFKKLKNLIIHRRIHTGERPFKCEYENCDKSFRSAHCLTTHRRTHLKENIICHVKN